jgi:hypothetical protein
VADLHVSIDKLRSKPGEKAAVFLNHLPLLAITVQCKVGTQNQCSSTPAYRRMRTHLERVRVAHKHFIPTAAASAAIAQLPSISSTLIRIFLQNN